MPPTIFSRLPSFPPQSGPVRHRSPKDIKNPVLSSACLPPPSPSHIHLLPPFRAPPHNCSSTLFTSSPLIWLFFHPLEHPRFTAMRPSPSLPPQTPVTTLDELHTRSVKYSTHTCPNNSVEYATRPQPDSPSSSSQPPAPPTPPALSSRHNAVNISASMSTIQPKVQPNSPSQKLTTTSISINSNPSCLTLPEPATSLRREQLLKVSPQPPDSGIVDAVSLSTKSRQSITRKSLTSVRSASITFPYKLLLVFQVPPVPRLHTTAFSRTPQILIAR